MSEHKQLTVSAYPIGEVRLSATLFPEEVRHGAYVRGLSAAGARALAAELLQAADEVEQDPSAGPARPVGSEETSA
jgi:hypothetical protein